MWYVISIRLEDGRHYICVTEDMRASLEAHIRGSAGQYTRKHPPLSPGGSRALLGTARDMRVYTACDAVLVELAQDDDLEAAREHAWRWIGLLVTKYGPECVRFSV